MLAKWQIVHYIIKFHIYKYNQRIVQPNICVSVLLGSFIKELVNITDN